MLSVELMLALGTIFCTVAGYYAVLPMMEAARRGEGAGRSGPCTPCRAASSR